MLQTVSLPPILPDNPLDSLLGDDNNKDPFEPHPMTNAEDKDAELPPLIASSVPHSSNPSDVLGLLCQQLQQHQPLSAEASAKMKSFCQVCNFYYASLLLLNWNTDGQWDTHCLL
jgi:hypothetical protein